MPSTVVRILWVLAAAIATLVLYVLVYIWICRSSRIPDAQALLITDAVAALVFSCAWIVTWRFCVRWTRARMMWTGVTWVLAVIPAIGAFFLTLAIKPYDEELGCVLGGLSWWAAWIFATAIVWRESEQERVERVSGSHPALLRCASCGYNMTGLYEARCPECGAQYTLDQIVASAIDADNAREARRGR